MIEDVMQQPQSANNEILLTAINVRIDPIVRQLERVEERIEARTRDLETRLEALRKELVAQNVLEPELRGLKAQIERVDRDRIDDRKEAEKRMDKIEQEQISKQDRLWIRLGQIAGITALLLALFEFLTHLKVVP